MSFGKGKNVVALVAAGSLSLMTGIAVAGGGHGGGHGASHHGDFAFGAPADASQADRTIKVEAKDSMSYSPSIVKVEAGETVRFVVKNVGSVQHSFTLATASGQQSHEQGMQGMNMERMASHMKNEPNGMVLQPGETKTLTWRFSGAETVQFACHVPGHYAAGMKGQISIDLS